MALSDHFFETVSHAFQTRQQGLSTQPSNPLALCDLVMILSKGLDLLEGRSLRSGIRVATIAASIAEELNVPQRQKTALLYAALLHDIGLVHVAAELAQRLPEQFTEKQVFAAHPLRLPDELSTGVLQQFRTHPTLGGEFIDGFGLSSDVKDIIALHHERLDGTGYPLGLTGSQIPILAQILGFADAVEASMEGAVGVDQRKANLTELLNAKGASWFEASITDAFQGLYLESSDLTALQQLYTQVVEALLRQQFPQRHQGLSGQDCLKAVANIGRVIDTYSGSFMQGHAEKTATIAQSIAHQLEIPQQQQGELLLAGYLCNLGMLSVPVNVLTSAESLTDEQWALIHEHPKLTERILKDTPGFETLAVWAGEHHEKMNGSGYPHGKKGFEISVGGRILALADNYTALSQPRPYRSSPFQPLDALPLIGQGRFKFYDSPLVTVLRRAVLDSEYVVQ